MLKTSFRRVRPSAEHIAVALVSSECEQAQDGSDGMCQLCNVTKQGRQWRKVVFLLKNIHLLGEKAAQEIMNGERDAAADVSSIGRAAPGGESFSASQARPER